jgi:hypothetical protein
MDEGSSSHWADCAVSRETLVPFRGDGPDRNSIAASALVDVRDGDGKLVKRVSPGTADKIIDAGGMPVYDSRRRLVRVTVDLSRRANDASRTTIGNLPATSGGGYRIRRSGTVWHGQPVAGRRTDRNVQSEVSFHERCKCWNVALPRSDKL